MRPSYGIDNSMQWGYFWDGNSSPPSQIFPCILCNQDINHYYQSSTFFSLPRQINPAHNIFSSFCNVCFNIILPLTPRSSKWSLSFRFLTGNLHFTGLHFVTKTVLYIARCRNYEVSHCVIFTSPRYFLLPSSLAQICSPAPYSRKHSSCIFTLMWGRRDPIICTRPELTDRPCLYCTCLYVYVTWYLYYACLCGKICKHWHRQYFLRKRPVLSADGTSISRNR